MAEQPALHRIHVIGYAANDRDFPTVALVADPRVAGYQVPKDLSACPDKRYPNHVFTGAQPIAGDQRVRHVWEILPSPWVPFTRYDDDLGPIQGRRRSVKNDGQVASLTADKRTTYEAREGSAIVYTELEETWSIATDDDGNSLFPIRDRDFYDPSRGPVQERRQLFVPTGEEEGSLENVNGVITQTSYEPYNEFLSVKIVQTYKVNGPQLIGKATDNDGQLVTVTTQRKGAKDYVAPNPTATRTVEASREDAESLVERIVDTPEVFGAESYQKTRADLTPQKFRAAQEDTTFEQTIAGIADSNIVLATGEFAKSEQQINKFVKRVATTSRVIDEVVTLVEKVLTPEGKIGTRVLTLASGDQSFTPSATLIDANVEALGDGRTVKTETTIPQIFEGITYSAERPDPVPQKFRVNIPAKTTQFNIVGNANQPVLSTNDLSKSEQQVTDFVKRVSTTSRDPIGGTSLTGQIYTSELGGGIATVIESYGDNPNIDPDTGTVSAEKENLGNNQFVTRQVKLSNLPELKGQNYDETLDVTIPFTRQFVESGASFPNEPVSINPRDILHSEVTKFDYEESRERLLAVKYTTPVVEQINLPDQLIRASLVIYYDSDSSVTEQRGVTFSFNASVSVVPAFDLFFETRDGFSGPVPAINYLFFLEKENCNIGTIESKVGAKSWPIIRQQNEKILVTSIANKINVGFSASLPNNFTRSSSFDKTRSVTTFQIPPTLHSGIGIQTNQTGAKEKTLSGKVEAPPDGVPIFYEYTANADVSIVNGSISATSPPSFPTGRFIYRSSASPFRFGLVRVEATVINVTQDMV